MFMWSGSPQKTMNKKKKIIKSQSKVLDKKQGKFIMTILLKISNYFVMTIITNCAYFIIFGDVQIHITDLTLMATVLGQCLYDPFMLALHVYLRVDCALHVYLRVDCAMHYNEPGAVELASHHQCYVFFVL